jgi:dCMP deaminase
MKALIVYIPAIHKGYIDFLKNNLDAQIFLLDLSLVREIPRMERDIRALDAQDVSKALQAVGFSKVSVLKKSNLSKIKNAKKIIMPDEDVSHNFAKENLQGKNNIEFISIFLRWDKDSSKKTSPVVFDGKISRDDFNNRIINKAFKEASKSSDWWRQVGALLLKNKKILIAGFNKSLPNEHTHNIFGDPRSNFDYGESIEISKFIHAEALVIATAAKKGIKTDKTDIYVTTFPCPVCAKSIALAGIKRVYYSEGYSLLDAKDILESFDVEIIKVESPIRNEPK